MRNKLVWAAVFGLVATLFTGVIPTYHGNYYVLGCNTLNDVTALGVPFNYLTNTVVRIDLLEPAPDSNGTYTNVVTTPTILDTQHFWPIDFVFDWAIFAFIMTLVFGAWKDFKCVFDSVENYRLFGRVSVLSAGVLFFAPMFYLQQIGLGYLNFVIWGFVMLFNALEATYYINCQEQDGSIADGYR